MMVDTTVYGWVVDSSIVCARCVDLDYWSADLAKLLRDDAQPLYSIDDSEPEGMACDDGSDYRCTGWVFEPSPEYCFDCGEAHWTTGEAIEAGHTEEEWTDRLLTR